MTRTESRKDTLATVLQRNNDRSLHELEMLYNDHELSIEEVHQACIAAGVAFRENEVRDLMEDNSTVSVAKVLTTFKGDRGARSDSAMDSLETRKMFLVHYATDLEWPVIKERQEAERRESEEVGLSVGLVATGLT